MPFVIFKLISGSDGGREKIGRKKTFKTRDIKFKSVGWLECPSVSVFVDKGFCCWKKEFFAGMRSL